ncbi:hypothetical protein K8R47_03250 [archaeon]|nr:hypothetical protein [archaeon]
MFVLQKFYRGDVMKLLIIVLGIITVVVGLLPFLMNLGVMPTDIPSSGLIYQGVIVLIGVILVFYGKRWL